MTTKIQGLVDIARKYDDLMVDAQVASGGAAQITCNDFIFPNVQQLIGRYVHIYSGGGNGQTAVVSSYNPSNKTTYFANSLSPQASTNSMIIMTNRFHPEAYLSAFDIAYTRIYRMRENTKNIWSEWSSAISIRQNQWANERTNEQSGWVTSKKGEIDAWFNQQTKWELAISDDWKTVIASLKRPDLVYLVPTLNIQPPGTLVVPTMPVGSLSVPSLNLAAIPSSNQVPSMSSNLPDEPLLDIFWEQNLIYSRLGDGEKASAQYSATVEAANTHIAQEQTMIQNLRDGIETLWTQHKQQYDISWANNKDKFENNWDRHKANYESYKASIETRLQNIKTAFL